jgi:hypothetical protein
VVSAVHGLSPSADVEGRLEELPGQSVLVVLEPSEHLMLTPEHSVLLVLGARAPGSERLVESVPGYALWVELRVLA